MANMPRGSTLAVALISLAVTGACLGVSTNLAKVAADIGLPPLAFLAWSILGAAAILVALAAARGQLPPLTRRTIEYFIFAAVVTAAGPNLIFVLAVPHVGAGFVALVITLPPLLTYAGALVLSMERFSSVRAAGVLAALGGAGVLAAGKFTTPDVSAFWVLLTFLGPVMLAVGNLYRTLRWPAGLSAEALAPGMMAAAAVMLFLAGLLPGATLAVPMASPWPIGLILLQTAVFTIQFLVLFVLQRSGGPVLLSLLGAVGALVGVPIAVFALGEQVPEGLALGAALIALGIFLVARGGARPAMQD